MRSLMRKLLAPALLLALVPALHAQLDSRLTTTTDLLDVYKSAPAKPELLTVFDFSGSMHALYWHSSYYADAGQANHGAKWFTGTDSVGNSITGFNDGDFPGMVPIIDAHGQVYVVLGSGYYQNINQDRNDYFYWPQAMDNTGTGRLVQPDGNLVSVNTGSNYSQAQLDALVKQASHIRITATYSGVTRTIDLPLPWAIFTRTSNSNASSIIATISDPSGGPAVIPDTLYAITNQDNIVNKVQTDTGTGKDFYKIGRLHYNVDYLWWIFFGQDVKNATKDGTVATGAYIIPDSSSKKAWDNGLPEMTRYQALKNAAVQSWMNNQSLVWWGYRFLDGAEEKFGSGLSVKADNGSASSSTVTRDIRLFRTAQNSSSADPGVKHFTDNDPSTSTPLTYAFANAYTQLAFTSDPSSSFGTSSSGGGQSGTESPIPTCRKSFVVVFTDGIANDSINGGNSSAIGTATDAYAKGSTAGTGSEVSGNAYLSANGGLNALVPGTSGAFNMWTLAGVAAHYPAKNYTGPSSGSSTYTVPTVAPWPVTTRGATTSNPRRIRTMTVGMSLAGTLTDTTSGKSDLYRAALYGNPDSKTWDLNTPPFDPASPDNNDPSVNPFFFDAQDVTQLSAAMTAIINEVTAASASISAPSSPLVGLNLGKQAYLGLFQTARTGPVWQGDLLMAGITVGSSGINFLDGDGNVVTDITSANAGWSAADSLQTPNRSWMPSKSNGRKVYTTLTNTTTTLTRVNDSDTSFTNAMMNASSDTERKQILRFLLGAGPTAVIDPTIDLTRSNILGDIISSSPAALEYPLSSAGSDSVLAAWLAGEGASATDKHFRVIYVADNQGYFHAFGEVSGQVTVGTSKAVHGVVNELWAFVPNQNLPAFKYLMKKSNSHLYLFDGSPRLYFLDQPAAGQAGGNGIVDGSDQVRVIIGMGKGGRSYFSFDVKDPFTPVLSWSLNPDVSTDPVIQRMGLATSRPSIGRVDVAAGGFKDLLFLGGGLSTLEIDTAFSANAPVGFGAGTKMGRSIVALDILTGIPYRTLDLTSTTFTNVGSISTGVFPFELVTGSNRTQRLYFTDQPTAVSSGLPRGSAVWAIGTTLTRPDGLRYDSSTIDFWTTTGTAGGTVGLRKIYQAQDGVVASSLPSPFNLAGPYPVPRSSAPFISVPAVGVAIGMGNRWDPMDRDTVNPTGGSGSGQNKFVLVFDRQDSAILASNTPSVASVDTLGLQDSNLTNLTAVSTLTDPLITPGNASFYLANSYGYYLNLGAGSLTPKSGSSGSNGGSNYYYPKVVTSAIVLEGVGFFSSFNGSDTAGACGGSGNSKTYRLCNILQPVYNSGTTLASATTFDTSQANCSGIIGSWVNIPGDLTSMGTTGVIQSGQGKTTDGTSGTIGNAGAQVLGGSGKLSNYAFRPRAWRIVR